MMELWGGLEPTIARIRDCYRDQCAETGHRDRPEDLDRIAALGIRTLRHPVIWESVAPRRPEECDWRWHDERLGRLRTLGIRPIAGLLHHGSGPIYTNLLDPDFPRLFAEYAGRVARRYPWIDLYTPVNEPLTTARFSALYGHWYPHEKDDRAFLAALVAECEATVLAMRAIREVNPAAQLVQTEDFGRTFSTPALSYQAEHENERRWLTFDLLCGQVDSGHALSSFLRSRGVSQRALDVLAAGDCAPDIIGINHYLTSERFLDERTDRYPPQTVGGNGRQRYADVEAVRMAEPGAALGPAARLMEVWERYHRPIAITEVHLGCTREEQLRWLAEVWRGAEAARDAGADIRAVTIWAMFGAVDWNSLLTRREGYYEPGPFDTRGPAPRATALAQAARSLATSGHFDHPVLDGPGWWRRGHRFYDSAMHRNDTPPQTEPRQLLILGPDGPLTQTLARIARVRGLFFRIERPEACTPDMLARDRIWAIIEAGGRASSDLLAGARRLGIAHLHIDLRDPGTLPEVANRETRSSTGQDATLTVRTGPVFGPWDQDNFGIRMLADLAADRELALADEIIAPTYLPDLVHVALDLLIDGETGLWLLANLEPVSWTTFAEMLAHRAGYRPRIPANRLVLAQGSPPMLRGPHLMPSLANALDRFAAEAEGWQQLPQNFPMAAE
jgi:dTDP-4-dehydrorhamnose reductase